jgi:riboflavin synthase
MFSGIVRDLGKIKSINKTPEGYRFKVHSRKLSKIIKVADSVAINGTCHTVVAKSKNYFEIDSVHETLKKTNMGSLIAGDEVNLETSLKIGDELGGHFVYGHIDDTAKVSKINRVSSDKTNESDNWEFYFRINRKHRKNLIYVGSVAINGVSLTVAKIFPVKKNTFEIMIAIIPFTYHNTNFKNFKVGDSVNIEFDFLGKYVLNSINYK